MTDYVIYDALLEYFVEDISSTMKYPEGTIIRHDQIDPPDCEEKYYIDYTNDYEEAKSFSSKLRAEKFVRVLSRFSDNMFAIMTIEEAQDQYISSHQDEMN